MTTLEYEPSTVDWVREQVQRITETGTTDGETLLGRPIVLLTYHDEKSSKLHRTQVMRVEHNGRYVLIASKDGASAHPQWYPSLIANPTVEVQNGTTTGTYRVREADGDEKATLWRRAVEAFPTYAAYQGATDREILLLVLERFDVT